MCEDVRITTLNVLLNYNFHHCCLDVEEDVELSEVDDTHKGVAQNKSVIMYMLGQVKIGMDLSKVG